MNKTRKRPAGPAARRPPAQIPPAAKAPSRKHGATHEGLLKAGLRLFAEKGFEGISVKDIEAEVGLAPGRGSFYRHFESKEALLAGIVNREVEKLRSLRQMQQRGISGSLGDRRAELIVDYRIRLIVLDQMKDFISILGREYGRFPELMDPLYTLLVEESLSEEGGEVERDIANRRVRGSDPHALAAVIQSALTGFHLSKTYFGNQPHGIDDDRFIKALVDLLIPPAA